MTKLARGKNWFFLFGANFLSVFNDNFLKNAIIFISMSWLLPSWFSSSQIIAAVSAALVIPYLIFSPLSGRISSKYRKQKIFRHLKSIEIPLMILASIVFYYQWIFLAIAIVFIMGVLSCLYSPAKYGLIRDIGGKEHAPFGSGMIEAMAFLGILLGTLVASLLSDHYQFKILLTILIGIALLGYILASYIRVDELPIEKEENSNVYFFKFLVDNYTFSRKHAFILPAIIGYATFWGMAGLLQMNLIIYGKNVLQCSNSAIGLIMGGAAVGIILGCALAGKLATEKNRISLVLSGTISMSLIMAIILILNPPTLLFGILITFFSFAGGFFQVPCLATIQQADIGRKMTDIIAFLNFITFLFVLLATLFFSTVHWLTNENSKLIFAALIGISLGVSLYLIMLKNKKNE